MEIISPSFSNPYIGVQENDLPMTNWTPHENKMFEEALAVFDESTPERWVRVAEKLPGKSVADVIRRYQELEADISSIEAGLYPIPSYDDSYSSPFTLNSYGFGKRGSGRSDLERKKGVPWTEEEHKLFLLGLKKYGKGDWRNISRNFVVSRTPTQVASHAQKYFIRQLSGAKDKRRSSIHDITTVDSHALTSNSGNISAVDFPGDMYGSSAYGIVDSFGVKARGGEVQSMGFQME